MPRHGSHSDTYLEMRCSAAGSMIGPISPGAWPACGAGWFPLFYWFVWFLLLSLGLWHIHLDWLWVLGWPLTSEIFVRPTYLSYSRDDSVGFSLRLLLLSTFQSAFNEAAFDTNFSRKALRPGRPPQALRFDRDSNHPRLLHPVKQGLYQTGPFRFWEQEWLPRMTCILGALRREAFPNDDEDARRHATLSSRAKSRIHDVADGHVLLSFKWLQNRPPKKEKQW